MHGMTARQRTTSSPRRVRVGRLLGLAALAATTVVGGGAAAPSQTAVATTSGISAAADCAATSTPSSAAKVRPDATVQEPALYDSKQAKKYGVIKPHAYLGNGSVTIDTVFHVITDGASQADRTRLQGMVDEQIDVLNDAYSGASSTDGADTPFRFDLTETNFVDNARWHNVEPGKSEKEMKAALHEGDSETLNVYAADIGGGLLGWAYFPKGYNNGRDYIDGVVILDESMPGGSAAPYNLGDTLTHEVGHWLMLEHTFQGACSAAGDGVADTPREAVPQFECGTYDTCPKHAGNDPVTNFMDYSEDFCMDHFTPGQAKRMSDAWINFRADGAG